MITNSKDLIKTILKIIGVIVVLVIIAGIGKGIWINFGTNDEKIVEKKITTVPLKENKKVTPTKITYAYSLIAIEKPVVESGGYDIRDPITGMSKYESYCYFSYEKEYLVTENIRKIENYSKRDEYDIIDQVRQDQKIKWRLSAYNSNIENDLYNCSFEDKKRFREGNYKAKIEEIKVLTFDTYEKAWEDKEKRR